MQVLAGITPENVEVSFFDDNIEEIPYEEGGDLVGISAQTLTARRSYEIADRFRSLGVPVVLGGFHPSCLPGESLEHADAVVIGQAEKLWERVVEDARRGRLQRIYRHDNRDVIEYARPDGSILEGKSYLRVSQVETGRGCLYACEFCSVREFFGGRYNPRPDDQVVDDVTSSGNRFIVFVDDNITTDQARLEGLCRRLAPLRIFWISQSGIAVTKNPGLLSAMAKSGCKALLIGFESLDYDNVKQMKKPANRVKDYEQAIGRLNDHGISVHGSFVFGYDHDTRESVERTLAFALEQKMLIVNFNVLTPFPGTRLYDRLEEEGRLLNKTWWLDPGYRYGDATFLPKGMSPEELTEACGQARMNFYRPFSLLRRALNFKSNTRSISSALFYLAMNTYSREEDLRKMNTTLGREG